MQPFAIAHAGLDRVTKGVAQVEQCSLTVFMLISHHDLSLILARPVNDVRQRFRFARQHPFKIRLNPFKKGQIADQPVFDHFSQTRPQFPVRQCI